MTNRAEMESRALGALVGAALGDALGMPTQLLAPEEIAAVYGHVDRFVEPLPDHPVSRGMAAGTVTDDTEQMLLLASELLKGDAFDQRRWVAGLAAWEDDIRARGGQDLLGPSTKRAIAAIRAGERPEEAGRFGDTNGAAMRIAPVGVMMPTAPLDRLVEKVAETSLATHNTSIGIASAAAVAAAVSAGVAGGSWTDAIGLAQEAARIGERHGHWMAGASVAARIGWAVELVRDRPAPEALRQLAELVGTSVAAQESVPAAFAVLTIAGGDSWQSGVLAANLGGDTDTIGAIAGAVGGACQSFERLPAKRIGELRGIEIDHVRQLATALVARRMDAAAFASGPGGRDAA